MTRAAGAALAPTACSGGCDAWDSQGSWFCSQRHPPQHVKPPQILDDEDIHFYAKEQLELLYATAEERHRRAGAAFCWGPVWKLLANTGLRRGEALHARWSWIRDGKLTVVSTEDERTKSGKRRTIPLSPGALAALATIPRGDEYIPPRITAPKLSNRFVAHAEAARIGGSLHWLRHTFISHLVMRGVHMRVVQKLAGHSSVIVTEKYTHLAPDYMKDTVQELDL
jgi:integrase